MQATIETSLNDKQMAIGNWLTNQNQRLEENTSQAASATSQLNSQLADTLSNVLQLENQKSDLEREVEKLEELVGHLQVSAPLRYSSSGLNFISCQCLRKSVQAEQTILLSPVYLCKVLVVAV